MVSFCEPNGLSQCCWMVQIGNVPYTDIFGDGAIILAESLEDCCSCAMQLGRFIATHINVVDEQFTRMEVYYAGKDLS